MSFTDNLNDPTIDRWLRRHRPRTELALRYSLRDQFNAVQNNSTFNARIEELFVAINPSDAEYAAILRGAHEIESAVAKLLDD